MTNLDKEIRRILLGKTKLLDDGRLSTLEDGDYIMPRGISDGAVSVRFFGVARRARVLESDLPDWKLKETVRKTMQDIGRGIVLQKEPEAVACLLRYLLTRPVVLCFYYQGEQPVLAACTGRGLTGWISRLRAIHSFEKNLPDTVEISGVKPPDLREEEKEKKKQEKAAKKQEKQKRKEEKKSRAGKKKAREEYEEAAKEKADDTDSPADETAGKKEKE